METELPIRYFETHAMMAAFGAKSARLRALTPRDLQLVEHLPGRSPVVVACFSYTQTTIGDYGEVGICWPVVHTRRRPPTLLPMLGERRWPNLGYWVHRLPVTTPAACTAGRSIWGYPKFIADIRFDWQGATRICTLAEGGSEILRLSLDTRLTLRPMKFPLVTYSRLGDELLRTRVEVDAVGTRKLLGPARLTLGPHPVGRELAELDLRLDRPIEVRWFPVYRAVLPRAEARWALHDRSPLAPEVGGASALANDSPAAGDASAPG